MKKILLLNFLLLSSIFAETFIFDLGDVLCTVDRKAMVEEIGGIGKFLSYLIKDWKSPNIKPLVFEVLATFGIQEGDEEFFLRDAHDEILPQIMVEWLQGLKTGPEIIELARQRIEDLSQDGFFVSKRERSLVEKTIEVMFDPIIFARNTKPIDKGIKLLERLSSMRNPDGSPRHTLYILSNWDALSFDHVYKNCPELFGFFDRDNITISGASDFGRVKPHVSTFEYLLQLHQLNPDECVFIDDRPENCHGAEAAHIKHVFQLEDGNYRRLKRELRESGLLD